MAQLLSWREGLLAGVRKQNDAITQRKRVRLQLWGVTGAALRRQAVLSLASPPPPFFWCSVSQLATHN
jgi:hypothetical protein